MAAILDNYNLTGYNTQAEWERLYTENYPIFKRVLRKYEIPEFKIDDLLQEAYFRLFLNSKRLKGDKIMPYFWKILKSVLIDDIRKYKSKKQDILLAEENSENPENLNLPQDNLYWRINLQQLEENRIAERLDLESVLNRLTPTYQLIFNLYQNGFKYSEITDILQIPLGTAKSRLGYAKMRIKKMLGKDYLVN